MDEPPVEEPAEERPWDRRRTVWAVVTGAIVVAIAALLVVGLMNRGVDNRIDEAIEKGERAEAPDFTLPVLVSAPGSPGVGEPLSLSDLRGQVVVVNIWASWCNPCRDEAPILESVWRRYRDQGVVVLGLNVRDLEGKAIEFHKTYDMTFPSVRDGEGEVMTRYGSLGVPETFIVDRQGRVAAALRGQLVSGSERGNLDGFQRALDQVLAEPDTEAPRP